MPQLRHTAPSMGMRRFMPSRILLNLLLVLNAALISAFACRAQDFPRHGDIDEIRRIVNAGFRDNYLLSDSLAIDLEKRYPQHPIGFVLHAAMEQSEMLDLENFDFESNFYELIQQAEDKSKKIIDSSPHDAWAWYSLGLARGSRAVYDARKGSWWSATRRGIRAKRAFTECIRSDSTFYDAYVGLGSYHYWRSVKTKAVNWLPFVQDDREEGIRELNLAIERSRFSADFARNSLMWIMIDREQYVEAESLAVAMQRKYPEGRKFLWGIGEARMKKEDYQGAALIYLELLDRLATDSTTNNFNTVECRCKLAQICFMTERFDDCIAQCDSADSLILSDDIRKRVKGRLSNMRKLREKSEKRKQELAAGKDES